MKINLLIIDDQEVVRVGLVSLLNGTDIKIVGEASDGAAGVKLAAKLKPNVVLLEVSMTGMDGLDTLKKLCAAAPVARVVMFSAHDNPTFIARAIALGASDYVCKGASRNDILTVITAAAKGESPASAGEMRKVAAVLAKTEVISTGGRPLTSREAQVLRLVAYGLSNIEIASALQIGVETAKEHVQNIMRKLEVNHRTQAAVWAVRKGVV